MPGWDHKRRTSVATYLVIAFGLALVAVGALAGLTARSAFERERARVAESLREAAGDSAFSADRLLPKVEGILSGLIAQADLLQPAECREALRGLQVFAAQGNVTVFDPAGRFVCGLVEHVGGASSEPGDWFAAAVGSDRPMEHAPVLDPASGRPGATVTIPLPAGGSRHGILAATLYTDAQTLVPPPGTPEGLVMLGLSNDGALVLSASEGAPYVPGPAPTGADFAGQADRRPAVRVDPDGVQRLYVGVTAPQSGRRVLAGLPVTEVLAPARAELRTHLLIMAGIMAAIIGLAVGLWRALVQPIRRLRRAIDASNTDDAVEAPIAGPAEVAAVARAFNQAIGRRRQLESQLADQALHDPLTGLPNRLLLGDRLVGALARRRRSGSGLVGVAFLDLDRFKLLNDSHGHGVGDQVLVAVARRLEASLRSTDTVARFGGDEFVIVAEALESVAEVRAVAERVLGALVEPILLASGEGATVCGSVGLAVAVTGREAVDDLLRDADTAMYHAKENRRGSFALYDEGMRTAVLTRLEVEQEIRDALTAEQFRVDYQPKYDLASARIVALEALVRWRHPTRGPMSPSVFIPIAEEAGLISALGEWVLRAACKQVRQWRNSGYDLAVSVNVSSGQLNPGFATRVVDILAETQARPEDLCLEIAEGALIAETGATGRELAALRAIGVRIAIDDFGTGHSFLSYLHAVPADELKIDRPFVARITRDPAAAAVVGAIAGLAKGLGLGVVAEGVETAAEVELLQELGCQTAQGYHLCRPKPAADLAEHLARHARRHRGQAPASAPQEPAASHVATATLLTGVAPAGHEPS